MYVNLRLISDSEDGLAGTETLDESIGVDTLTGLDKLLHDVISLSLNKSKKIKLKNLWIEV